MAYVLKPSRPLGREVRRVIVRQIGLALRDLAAGPAGISSERLHAGRRHIKKARAVLQLAGSTIEGAPHLAHLLRDASRLLGPAADAGAIVETWNDIAYRRNGALPTHVAKEVRAWLMARQRRLLCTADTVRDHAAAVVLLSDARGAAETTRVDADGFHALEAAWRRTHDRAAQARAKAHDTPSHQHLRRWRQRVKRLWLQSRLLSTRGLPPWDSFVGQLEELDGLLGDTQNCVLLVSLLRAHPLPSRDDTAAAIHIVRAHRATLRKKADLLARQVEHHRPERLAAAGRIHWSCARRDTAGRPGAPGARPCAPSA